MQLDCMDCIYIHLHSPVYKLLVLRLTKGWISDLEKVAPDQCADRVPVVLNIQLEDIWTHLCIRVVMQRIDSRKRFINTV